MKRASSTRRHAEAPAKLSKSMLSAMIEEATVDAYGESELATGWFTMFEQYLGVPFVTRVLGVDITVMRIDLRDDERIVAICKRGRDRLVIALEGLPLPSPRTAGSEWIEAYRCWLGGSRAR